MTFLSRRCVKEKKNFEEEEEEESVRLQIKRLRTYHVPRAHSTTITRRLFVRMRALEDVSLGQAGAFDRRRVVVLSYIKCSLRFSDWIINTIPHLSMKTSVDGAPDCEPTSP